MTTMIKTLAVPVLVTMAALVVPDGAWAHPTEPSLISGEDAYLSQTVVDSATGSMTYLTITGARSTLIQVGQPASTSLGCEVDITQYDAAGNLLLQGIGFSDPDATTLTISQNLAKATLDASMIFVDFNTGEVLTLDVALSFKCRGPVDHTVTDNGDPSQLLVKDSRASVAAGTIQIGAQSLNLGGQPAQLERSLIFGR
jgi:hypothetical protein